MKQLFKLAELSLKAHVWENDGAALARELESLLELHVFLLHEVGDDAASTAGDACIAMDKHAALCHALFDKRNRRRKVPDEARLGRIGH